MISWYVLTPQVAVIPQKGSFLQTIVGGFFLRLPYFHHGFWATIFTNRTCCLVKSAVPMGSS